MTAHYKQDETANPKAKVPYQRPELKKVGRLRDVTAGGATPDFDEGAG